MVDNHGKGGHIRGRIYEKLGSEITEFSHRYSGESELYTKFTSVIPKKGLSWDCDWQELVGYNVREAGKGTIAIKLIGSLSPLTLRF